MSFEFLNAFKFLKKNTIIHRLDPRVKLLFSLVYTINALMFTEIVPLIFIFLSLLPFIVLINSFSQEVITGLLKNKDINNAWHERRCTP